MKGKTLNRIYRRRWWLTTLAALPLFQTTGTCDASSIGTTLAGDFLSSTISLVFQSMTSTLLQFFPGANALQTLLGGNPNPFFH